MRCVICDCQSSGLSEYDPMGRYYSMSFHQLPSGDMICSNCYSYGDEALAEFDVEEEIANE